MSQLLGITILRFLHLLEDLHIANIDTTEQAWLLSRKLWRKPVEVDDVEA